MKTSAILFWQHLHCNISMNWIGKYLMDYSYTMDAAYYNLGPCYQYQLVPNIFTLYSYPSLNVNSQLLFSGRDRPKAITSTAFELVRKYTLHALGELLSECLPNSIRNFHGLLWMCYVRIVFKHIIMICYKASEGVLRLLIRAIILRINQ